MKVSNGAELRGKSKTLCTAYLPILIVIMADLTSFGSLASL